MPNTVADLIALAQRLDAAAISYELAINRNAVSFMIAVPGERWEVDFLENGTLDVEVFKSDGSISNGRKLDDLFARFSH